jgi:hypothetical protein
MAVDDRLGQFRRRGPMDRVLGGDAASRRASGHDGCPDRIKNKNTLATLPEIRQRLTEVEMLFSKPASE